MLQVEMNGAVRTVTGKGPMRQLRMQGLTPAVVYGSGSEGLALQFETQPLFQQLVNIYRKNVVVTLKLDNGENKNVMIREVQTDPIKDTLIHVDFQEIDLEKARIFKVPVQYVGAAKGADLGGIVEKEVSEVVVEAAPLNVPDALEINIAEMNIGDTIRVADISIPETLKMLSDSKKACVTILAPRKVEKEETEAPTKKKK